MNVYLRAVKAVVVVVVLALVGCYRPGSDGPCTVRCSALGECPGDLACNTMGLCALPGGGCLPDDASASDSPNDSPSDGMAIDAPSDGGVTAMCVPGAVSSTTALGQGTHFTPDLDGTPPLAVKYDNNTNTIVVVEDTPNTDNDALYAPMFPVLTNGAVDVSPRLAPTLQQAFFVRKVDPFLSLQRATRMSPGAWMTSTVLLKDGSGATTIPITGLDEIGAPTTTNPRYMLIGRGANVIEYREHSANEWRLVMTHSFAFTGITFAGHATLSENGRRMVFRGQIGAATVAGFYADRSGPGQPFTGVAMQISSSPAHSVETPYLSEDCRHFYYTHTTSQQIQHATLQ